MPSILGLEKIGVRLVQKHRLEEQSIFVCPTLYRLQEELKKIEELNASVRTIRKVFIVPTHSTLWGRNQEGNIPLRAEAFAQHIVAVAVEKREGTMHIVLLDPMVRDGNEEIRSDNIGLGTDFEGLPFSEGELILSYVVGSGLNEKTTLLYRSGILREKSNGCWAFALKDALAFLKLPSFFSDFEILQPSIKIRKFDLRTIASLPVNFMKSAQFSLAEFERYFQKYALRSNIRSKISKHQVNSLNLRIAHATVKWIQMLVEDSEQ
ncbi:hypothetical protein PHSC3_000974 [Chlamydiales bacterium STE3]|nr:hypothetical protein PHSC3_000974 [Chlamydiales bacterium STE3]